MIDAIQHPRPLRLAPLALAVALVGGACGGDDPARPAFAGGPPGERVANPIGVSVAPAVRAPMVSLYSTSATLRAEKRATVTSRTRGVLEQLFVEEGDPVTAGQPIAKLEDGEQAIALERSRRVHEIKQREFARNETLNEQELISDSELELTRREAQDSEHDLDLATLNYERTTIASPFDGIVVLRHLDVGATVNDGSPIFDLADLDPLYVDVNVPERHVARLAPGQTVRLSADAIDTSAEARIERLAPVVDATTGTVKVTVAVNASVSLRPGAFVQVDVVTDVHEEALVVPRSALVAEGRRWLVFRADEALESVEAVEVELGFEEGDRVEIARTVDGDPLEPGDTVVVLGASALSDGAAIRVLDSTDVEPPTDEAGDGDTAAAEQGGVEASDQLAVAPPSGRP